MTKYIYSYSANGILCDKCEERKIQLKTEGSEFEERDGHRLEGLPIDLDAVDLEAMARFHLQDMVFPVEFDLDVEDGFVSGYFDKRKGAL